MSQQQISSFTTGIVKLALGGLLALSIVFIFHAQHTSAESFDQVAEQGLSVSPVSVELNAEKGKTYTLDVKVTNVTGTDLSYNAEYFDFRAKDETGTPDLFQDAKLPASASVRTWLGTDNTFSLTSHQQKTLKIQVAVPKNAEPGGHYGVVAFSGAVPSGSGERVSIRVKTGLLVLIRVAGDIKESLAVEEFTATSQHKTPWFIENAPIDFTLRLKNTGNVHVKPNGAIEVRNMFGGLVGKVDLNKSDGNVLPKSIRRLEQTLNADWMIGMYNADLTVGYGTNGQALTDRISFWVIPYKPLLVLLAVLITLLFIIRTLIRRYKKSIIKEALEEQAEHEQPPVVEEKTISESEVSEDDMGRAETSEEVSEATDAATTEENASIPTEEPSSPLESPETPPETSSESTENSQNDDNSRPFSQS